MSACVPSATWVNAPVRPPVTLARSGRRAGKNTSGASVSFTVTVTKRRVTPASWVARAGVAVVVAVSTNQYAVGWMVSGLVKVRVRRLLVTPLRSTVSWVDWARVVMRRGSLGSEICAAVGLAAVTCVQFSTMLWLVESWPIANTASPLKVTLVFSFTVSVAGGWLMVGGSSVGRSEMVMAWQIFADSELPVSVTVRRIYSVPGVAGAVKPMLVPVAPAPLGKVTIAR